MARFDLDRASALAEFAIYTLLVKAMTDDTYAVSVKRNTIREALKQRSLHEDHEDTIARFCSKHGVAWGYSLGTYYFFMPDEIAIYEADHVLPDLTEEYAKLSVKERRRVYDEAELWPLIEKADKARKGRPSGKRR